MKENMKLIITIINFIFPICFLWNVSIEDKFITEETVILDGLEIYENQMHNSIELYQFVNNSVGKKIK